MTDAQLKQLEEKEGFVGELSLTSPGCLLAVATSLTLTCLCFPRGCFSSASSTRLPHHQPRPLSRKRIFPSKECQGWLLLAQGRTRVGSTPVTRTWLASPRSRVNPWDGWIEVQPHWTQMHWGLGRGDCSHPLPIRELELATSSSVEGQWIHADVVTSLLTETQTNNSGSCIDLRGKG